MTKKEQIKELEARIKDLEDALEYERHQKDLYMGYYNTLADALSKKTGTV